jgi:4-amino-4-deoxy-L-arabinose transferase-like glycosyltransferase
MIKSGNHVKLLAIILILGLALRLYVGTDLFLHEWDERYHALVAKNLMDQPLKPTLYNNPILPYDYKNWAGNHVWLHKQPFPLWCMALSMKIFGVNEIALRLPSILVSTLSILITFLIAAEFFGKKTALVAAFLHAIHGLLIELTGGRVATDHIDVFFQALIGASVLSGLYHAKTKNFIYLALMSVLCGFAVLTKWLPALIVFPLWILFWIMYQGLELRSISAYGAVALAMVFAVAAPWQFWIHAQYPLEANWESQYNVKHIFEGVEGHGRPFYYHFDKIRIIFGELIYIPLAWLAYVAVKKKRITYYSIAAWIFIPLLFFSFAKTKMQAYTLFAAPAFFMLTALFFRYVILIRKKSGYPRIALAIAIGLIALPVRYSIERVKPFSSLERSPAWAEEFRNLNGSLDASGKYVLFGEERYAEAMFYCKNLTAYLIVPDNATLQRLHGEGYTVYFKEKRANSISYKKITLTEIGK